MEILGGAVNIPQQFGIGFSMKLKPSNAFRSTKLHFFFPKLPPVIQQKPYNKLLFFFFFSKHEGKYLDGTHWIMWHNSIR